MSKYYIKRGDIFFVKSPSTEGSEQMGMRPCIVLQNDIGNKYSPTIIVATISSKSKKLSLPTHVSLNGVKTRLSPDSTILLEQIKTIDCCRLMEYIESANDDLMEKIDNALAISVGIGNRIPSKEIIHIKN